MRGDYLFYDSKLAVEASELQDLYRYTLWGKSRSIEGIEAMLEGSSMCFSARYQQTLVGFCRIITDFVYRASLWDVMVHPDHQGRGLGSVLVDYALTHPVVKKIPLILTYTTEWISFMESRGFERREGTLMMLRCPIEYS